MANKPKTSSRKKAPTQPVKKVKRTSSTPAPVGMKKILVPVDFSDSSKRSLHYALTLAASFRGRIIPLHVVEPVIYPSDMAFAPMAAELPTKVSVASMKKKLQQWCEEAIPVKHLGKPVVRLGQPFHEIALAAKEMKADLVVISTHGYTGLKHVLLGSTAERVVRHTPCPVLTVRRP